MASLSGKFLILACLIAAWALAAPARAQQGDDPDEPSAGPQDGFDETAQAADPFPAPKSTTGKGRGIPTRLSEMFIAGGPLMWPIAGCSVVVLAFAFERLRLALLAA